MTERRRLANRRQHVTQKFRIAGQRTLYVSVHDDEQPAELFLRLKGPDCSSELIGLYDVIARLVSIALQHGAPLDKLGDLLTGVTFAPAGPVSGHGAHQVVFELTGSHRAVPVAGILRTRGHGERPAQRMM